jgi:hypothetical protein
MAAHLYFTDVLKCKVVEMYEIKPEKTALAPASATAQKVGLDLVVPH